MAYAKKLAKTWNFITYLVFASEKTLPCQSIKLNLDPLSINHIYRSIMALDWGMAAVIVAIAIIPLVISSTAADFIQLLFRKLRGFIWPYTTQCESMLWEDMPSDDNGIHDCGVTPDSCLHRSSRGTHITTPRCWNSTIAIMFNRAWNSPGRRARKPFKKPLQLDPNQTYLRTDAKTLLALLCVCDLQVSQPII